MVELHRERNADDQETGGETEQVRMRERDDLAEGHLLKIGGAVAI